MSIPHILQTWKGRGNQQDQDQEQGTLAANTIGETLNDEVLAQVSGGAAGKKYICAPVAVKKDKVVVICYPE